MSILICPVCGESLSEQGGTFRCSREHSFDRAREGYLNLLLCGRSRSKHPGDAPELCRARRAFLSKGYYAPLRTFAAERLEGDVVLDACCGEGYYTSAAAENHETYGFDIAKETIRLASKQDKRTQYFVAGLHQIPVRTQSVDTLMHLFAPFEDREFCRVLKKGGTLLHILPGEKHLFGLKKVLYKQPYLNPETPPDTALTPVQTERLRYDVCIESTEDILNLYGMTPYCYKTARTGLQKLSELSKLETTLDFVVMRYTKT